MAGLARNTGVKSEERKLREVMIEEDIGRPRLLIVTPPTVLGLLPTMDVIRRVTSDAAALELLAKCVAAMAPLAADTLVRTKQWKLGVLGVVEAGVLPTGRAVTGITRVTVPAPVLVITSMTAPAILGQLLLVEGARVTGRARGALVSADQRESRIPAVVEARLLPLRGFVATLALRAESTAVGVVESMTALAPVRHPMVASGRMTEGAGHFRMAPQQSKPRLVVVEPGRPPALAHVTVGARIAHAPIVRIVGPMAVDALARRLSELLRSLVTTVALCMLVGAFERKVAVGMVEGLLLQPHDVGIAPQMVGVAGSTFRAASGIAASVKTDLLLHVRRDRIVTIQAEDPLTLGLERFVTLATIGLEVGMASNQLARHDQALPWRCPSEAR